MYIKSNGCDSIVTYNVTINTINGGVTQLCAKVFLAGPFNTQNNLMDDSLRIKNLIPLIKPYSLLPYSITYKHVNGGGSETTNVLALSNTGNNAIVDWVFVRLHYKYNFDSIMFTKCALLQRDGDVVDPSDGISNLVLPNTPADNYYVSIEHRNHLGAITASSISLSNVSPCIDFTSLNTPLYVKPGKAGNPAPLWGATQVINNKRALYGGNCDILFYATSQFVYYNNLPSSDRKLMLDVVGPTAALVGYTIFDTDLNGFARFNGLDLDRLIIYHAVGGTNYLFANKQLPK